MKSYMLIMYQLSQEFDISAGQLFSLQEQELPKLFAAKKRLITLSKPFKRTGSFANRFTKNSFGYEVIQETLVRELQGRRLSSLNHVQ